MKIDVGLLIAFAEACNGGEQQEIQELSAAVARMLKHLISTLKEPLSKSLYNWNDKGNQVVRFASLWLPANIPVATHALAKAEEFDLIVDKKKDFIEAVVLSLIQVFREQPSMSDMWTTVEGLCVLFEYWIPANDDENDVCRTQELLLMLCEELLERLSTVRAEKNYGNHGLSDAAKLMKSSLKIFDIASENSKLGLLQKMIDVLTWSLVNPEISKFRELFWRASILVSEIAHSSPVDFSGLVKELCSFLFEMAKTHKLVDTWKLEAVLGLLTDLLPLHSSGPGSLLPDINSLISSTLVATVKHENLGIPCKTNAVYFVGLAFEHMGDMISKEAAVDCTESLTRMFFNDEDAAKSQILREIIIASFGRLFAHEMDPISVPLVVPYLHEELPLSSHVEDNLAVLKFWNIWFHTADVVSHNLEGLVDAIVRVARAYPDNDAILAQLSALFENMIRVYPEKIPGLLQKLAEDPHFQSSFVQSSQ